MLCPERDRGFESHPLRHIKFGFSQFFGEVSERPKEQHWKCCVGATLPRVRIPPSPPSIFLFGRARWGGSGALHPQSAIAGSMPSRGLVVWKRLRWRDVEGRVPRNVNL